MNNFQFYNFLSWQISSKFYNNDRSGKESLCTHILQEKVCNEWGITTQGNTGLIVVIDIYRSRGGVNII